MAFVRAARKDELPTGTVREFQVDGKTLAISGFRNWLLAESVRFAPRKVVTAISRWVAEPTR